MTERFWTFSGMRSYDALGEDTIAEVAVVGGGIAGILTARFLTDAGFDVILLEANRLCSGQTGNTTAKITVQHGFCYADILKHYGEEGARLYYRANAAALEKYKQMAAFVDCDFEVVDFLAYEKKEQENLAREIDALGRIGVRAELVREVALPCPAVGAIRAKEQATFHPTRFLLAMQGGFRIYENTPVTGVFSGGVQTAAGFYVHARYVVVATHFPFLRFRGGYPFKMYQSRSYTVAVEGAPHFAEMGADGTGNGISFRRCGDLLLLGGGAHRTGTAGGGFAALEKEVAALLPAARVVKRFAAQDCMTLDGMPYVGRYAMGLADVFVATGFGKWGMTSAMLSAMLLRDLICKNSTPYAALFAPNRHMPPLRLLRETGAVLRHYLRPTLPRCPHLGCALRFNRQERSWDCPCHGSRFTPEGKLIDAPAKSDLRRFSKGK